MVCSMTPARSFRHARILSELADLGLSVARELEASMRSASGPKEAAALAETFALVAEEARAAIEQAAALSRELRERPRGEGLGLVSGAPSGPGQVH